MSKDNIIEIKNIITENSGEIITISANDSTMEKIEHNFSYKISGDGKVINVNSINENKSKLESSRKINTKMSHRQILEMELINNSFENIPTEITENELESINEFAKGKIIKEKGFGRMYPFGVELSNEGDLNITLLMYNGNSQPLILTKFPFKLTDAEDKIVICDLVDINKNISPNKIGICNFVINKNKLVQTKIDLLKWNITFEIN